MTLDVIYESPIDYLEIDGELVWELKNGKSHFYGDGWRKIEK